MSEGLGLRVLSVRLQSLVKLPSQVGCLCDFLCYDGLGCGVVAEGGASGLDVGRELRPVERFLGRRGVFLRDDVVDGLFHAYFLLCNAEYSRFYCRAESQHLHRNWQASVM